MPTARSNSPSSWASSRISGNNPGVEKPDVGERNFLEFDMDNFDKRMSAIEPGVTFKVDNKLGDGEGEKLSVDLKFRKIDDFTPAAVARQVPSLARLLEARQQLSNLLRYMDGKVAASDQIKALLADPKLMEALKERLNERPATGEETE